MKFEYEEKKNGVPVACIYGGHLIFKAKEGGCIVAPSDLSAVGTLPFYRPGKDEWEDRLKDSDAVFYEGDTVKITF